MQTIIRRATEFMRSLNPTDICIAHGNPAVTCSACVQDRLEAIRRG